MNVISVKKVMSITVLIKMAVENILGCRIDGSQAEYVRVPFADQGLNKIPDEVTERQALFVGDVLATGYWATRISEITEDDTVLIIEQIIQDCTLLCVMLKNQSTLLCVRKTKNVSNLLICIIGCTYCLSEECERNLLRKQVIMVEQMLFLKLPELNQHFVLHGSAQDQMQL